MGAVALHTLHDDVCAVGLERHAIIAIIDVRILDDNRVASKRVPSITIFGRIFALTLHSNVDIAHQDITTISDEVKPLRLSVFAPYSGSRNYSHQGNFAS